MKQQIIEIKCDKIPDYIDVNALQRSIKAFKESGYDVTIKYTWPLGYINFPVDLLESTNTRRDG